MEADKIGYFCNPYFTESLLKYKENQMYEFIRPESHLHLTIQIKTLIQYDVVYIINI